MGPRTPKGVQTRARLVDAAMEVFAESSLLDARIADIAQRAGLSYGAFYHYFESKVELFREVATTSVERIGALVKTLILDDSPNIPFGSAPPGGHQKPLRDVLARGTNLG
jgi:AcrR family transcriptional regulator